jgi:hypothetical protein
MLEINHNSDTASITVFKEEGQETHEVSPLRKMYTLKLSLKTFWKKSPLKYILLLTQSV